MLVEVFFCENLLVEVNQTVNPITISADRLTFLVHLPQAQNPSVCAFRFETDTLNPQWIREKCAEIDSGRLLWKKKGLGLERGEREGKGEAPNTSAEKPRGSRSTILSRPEGPLARSRSGGCSLGDLGVRGGEDAEAAPAISPHHATREQRLRVG